MEPGAIPHIVSAVLLWRKNVDRRILRYPQARETVIYTNEQNRPLSNKGQGEDQQTLESVL